MVDTSEDTEHLVSNLTAGTATVTGLATVLLEGADAAGLIDVQDAEGLVRC